MSITAILIIIALIALNGLFVAAEFAIVGVPRSSIVRLARRGNWLAKRARIVIDDPRKLDRFIATAQLGITLASLGLGMYGEHALAAWIAPMFDSLGASRWIAAHTLASVIAVVVLSYLHVVFGEMVPKSVALQQARRTALWIVPIMGAIQFAFYPLVVMLNGLGNAVLRAIGIRREVKPHDHYRTAEELSFLVQEAASQGLMRRESGRLLQQLLEFGERTAAEVMVPRVHVAGLRLGADREEIRSALTTRPHARYPVYRANLDHILGVVHVRTLLRCLQEGRALSDADVRPAPFVPASAEMDAVLTAMSHAKSPLAVVLDEYGGTAGIVTGEDVFEEVVGEFGDDPAPRTTVTPEGTGRVRARGTARLDEVGSALGVVLEHEDVDSVGGLVMAILGRPPSRGDVVTYDGVQFEVVSVEGRGAREVIASLPDAPPGPTTG